MLAFILALILITSVLALCNRMGGFIFMSERLFVPSIPPEKLEPYSALWVEIWDRVSVFDPPEYRPRTHYPRSVLGQMSFEDISHA